MGSKKGEIVIKKLNILLLLLLLSLEYNFVKILFEQLKIIYFEISLSIH